jgi:sugar O-acyltransferase (sialic acid O-acetyltransferase NeuD family)
MTQKAKCRLILLGGGDLCRELLWTAASVPSDQRDWEPFGILDDNPDAAREHLCRRGLRLPVLGAVRDHQPKEEEVFLPAIGSPVDKLKTAELIESRGGRFINLLHPTTVVAPDTKMGIGNFCFVYSVISVGAVLEDFVTLNVSAVVGHDARVGRGSTLSPGSILCGNVSLGRGVFLGTGASIVPGQTAGDLSSLGAGSVALRSIEAQMIVFGVPARPITPPRASGEANPIPNGDKRL